MEHQKKIENTNSFKVKTNSKTGKISVKAVRSQCRITHKRKDC